MASAGFQETIQRPEISREEEKEEGNGGWGFLDVAGSPTNHAERLSSCSPGPPCNGGGGREVGRASAINAKGGESQRNGARRAQRGSLPSADREGKRTANAKAQ